MAPALTDPGSLSLPLSLSLCLSAAAADAGPGYTREDLDRAVSQIDTTSTIIVKLDGSNARISLSQFFDAIDEEEDDEELSEERHPNATLTEESLGRHRRQMSVDIETSLATQTTLIERAAQLSTKAEASYAHKGQGAHQQLQMSQSRRMSTGSDTGSNISLVERRLSVASLASVEDFPGVAPESAGDGDVGDGKTRRKKKKTIVRFLSFLDGSLRSSTMRESMSSVKTSMRRSIASFSFRRSSTSQLGPQQSFMTPTGPQRSIRKSMRSSLKLFRFFKKGKVSPIKG